eukprot:750075-Hanusia_phi.AAC.3
MRKPTQPHCVLEQELQGLLQVQRSFAQNKSTIIVEPCEEAEKEIRNRVRAIKNRLAAKKSRDQARTYVQKLESSLSNFVSHNETLSQRMAMAESDNEFLRTENRNLKRQVAELTRDVQRMSAELHLMRSAQLSKAQPAPGAAEQRAELLAENLSHLQPCAGLVSDKVPLTGSDALGSFPESNVFVSVEEWRKEKRRKQNREAQRRHRERQLCLHNRNIPLHAKEEKADVLDYSSINSEASEFSPSPEQPSDGICSFHDLQDAEFHPPGDIPASYGSSAAFLKSSAHFEQAERQTGQDESTPMSKRRASLRSWLLLELERCTIDAEPLACGNFPAESVIKEMPLRSSEPKQHTRRRCKEKGEKEKWREVGRTIEERGGMEGGINKRTGEEGERKTEHDRDVCRVKHQMSTTVGAMDFSPHVDVTVDDVGLPRRQSQNRSRRRDQDRKESNRARAGARSRDREQGAGSREQEEARTSVISTSASLS